ncbi:MAG: hypothetical protein LBU65_12235, partial [Planctomycetaceae bacterium]|nr:hypothetical protein [Planctomycetaceae bacterium]
EFDDKAEGFVARAVVDMTDAYKEQVRSARRTVMLQNDSMLTVMDELDGISEPVRWGMMTAAKIEVSGKKAALTRNKKTLNVEMTSDEVEQFEITTASPPTEKENQNEGFTMLTATAKPLNGKVRFWVTLKP